MTSSPFRVDFFFRGCEAWHLRLIPGFGRVAENLGVPEQRRRFLGRLGDCSHIWNGKMVGKMWFLWDYPIGSMYAIYGNIYHQYTPNVSIYTIHGSYGYGNFGKSEVSWYFNVVFCAFIRMVWGNNRIKITVSSASIGTVSCDNMSKGSGIKPWFPRQCRECRISPLSKHQSQRIR
jgi:hypothetical protein